MYFFRPCSLQCIVAILIGLHGDGFSGGLESNAFPLALLPQHENHRVLIPRCCHVGHSATTCVFVLDLSSPGLAVQIHFVEAWQPRVNQTHLQQMSLHRPEVHQLKQHDLQAFNGPAASVAATLMYFGLVRLQQSLASSCAKAVISFAASQCMACESSQHFAG